MAHYRGLFSEIEAVIHERPLTYVTSGAGEPEPLTPAHFYMGDTLLDFHMTIFQRIVYNHTEKHQRQGPSNESTTDSLPGEVEDGIFDGFEGEEDGEQKQQTEDSTRRHHPHTGYHTKMQLETCRHNRVNARKRWTGPVCTYTDVVGNDQPTKLVPLEIGCEADYSGLEDVVDVTSTLRIPTSLK